MPSTFDQLRTSAVGHKLRALVDHLVVNCANPAVINALLSVLPRVLHAVTYKTW
jgi:hypothetical protein